MEVIEKIGGPERDRTAGLLVANEALSQLSYRPINDGMQHALSFGVSESHASYYTNNRGCLNIG